MIRQAAGAVGTHPVSERPARPPIHGEMPHDEPSGSIRPPQPRRDLRRPRVPRAARRPRRGADELRDRSATRRRRRCCSSPGRPSRGGATKPPCRGWPSTSRCSPSICGARAAAPARRAATRSTTWATTWSVSSTWSSDGPRYVSGLSSGGVLAAWLSAYAKPGQVHRGAVRGSAAVRVRGPAGHGARHPSVHRPAVRPVEHLPGRPVVHRGVGRDARRRPGAPARVAEGHPGPGRAAPEPQGVRPRVGPVLLDREPWRRRATTSGCCAA